MGENTKIEWADHTWNPWVGCQKVSAACDFCYAETLMDTRLGRVKWGPHGKRERTSPANWRKPISWSRKAGAAGRRDRVFCASLADVFDNAVPEAWRIDLWHLIRETPNLIWMLLTKRPQNIAKMLPIAAADFDIRKRIWLGTTAENQEEADRRIPDLLKNHAAVHFASMEPLLGPADIADYLPVPHPLNLASTYVDGDGVERLDISGERIVGLDWIIVGGESGPNARPTHPDWVRSIRDQCAAAGVAFFLKQWGEWRPVPEIMSSLGSHALFPDGRFVRTTELYDDGRLVGPDEPFATLDKVGKKRAGRTLDGCVFDEMPA